SSYQWNSSFELDSGAKIVYFFPEQIKAELRLDSKSRLGDLMQIHQYT
ncbi:14472_t:CDS:2, partial [Funneliformis mosseae]